MKKQHQLAPVNMLFFPQYKSFLFSINLVDFQCFDTDFKFEFEFDFDFDFD